MAGQAHWDRRYSSGPVGSLSWFEERPGLSLQLLDRVGAGAGTSVIDVGGGASPLIPELNE